jgi:uncharacterized membrane protein YcaP (DUF421 family)
VTIGDLVQQGVTQNDFPIMANLKRQRLTVDELLAQARGQHIATLDEIRWAVLETSGKLSFIAK